MYEKNYTRITLIISANEVVFSSMFCLSVSNFALNFSTDLHEVFRECWQWACEQIITFW